MVVGHQRETIEAALKDLPITFALQEKQRGNNPVLVRIDTNAGHGAGKPTSKQIDEFSDIWSFVFYNLGMKY